MTDNSPQALRGDAPCQRQQAQAMPGLEHLRQAIDAHAIVSIADAQGRIVHVNDKFCAISGYTQEELLGQDHRLIKSGLHDAAFYAELWRTIRAGRVWNGEICNRRKNGEIYWVEATLYPVLGSQGAPCQFISIRTDITAIKAAEQTAETAKERLRRGQMYANIGTWDWNIVTGELFWTERIAPLFGYPAGDLETSYENFLAAIHPEDRQAVIDAVGACVERDAPYEIEHRVVWPDGRVRWLLERGFVQRDAAGRPMRMIGVVQDIDARKRAEAVLAERERQLLEAQRLAAIGNWSADLTNGELVWSDEIYRIFGHEPGSFAPSVAAFHAAVHPDDRALVLQSEARAAKTGRHDVVHRILRPDGSIRHVHELAQMRLDAAGQPLRLTGTVQDITERVAFEQALVEARETADRANQAKSDFLSSMSHELRTPMNAIIGFTQMLEYDSGMTPDQQDNVQEILKAGRHLLDLINEVLDLARIESGRVDLSMEGTDLVALGEDCLHLIEPIADQAGIDLRFELPAGSAVFADRVRLKQVLLNLLSNAIKYNRPGGQVRLSAGTGKPGHLRLLVADTGPGIAPARIKDLFEPFNRLGAEASEIEGTGIGLTITRRLVEMMGGEIGVESAIGIGSTFWVELALSQTAMAGAGATAGGVPGPLATSRGTATVLAIDDNPANLKLIAQVMGTRDHIHLLSAHTPELGIEQAVAHRPDLILLDINMPDISGYQVLEIFKANPALRAIPVIAITANAMPNEIERGKAAGFADYLTKPLDIARFLALLDHHLADEGGSLA